MKQPRIKIEKLKRYKPQSQNANRHTERGIQLLDDAMSEDGYVAPMTAAADGEIIDGSARLERAFERFGDEAIVIEHDGTRPIIAKRTDIKSADTPEAKRIALRANRIAQVDLDWDADILAQLKDEGVELSGMFTEKELAAILPQGESRDAEPQIDRAAELQEKWQTERGQLWEIGPHRLVCGDSGHAGDVFTLLGIEKADFMVTSPPYNVGVDYKTHDDSEVQWPDYEKFLTYVLDQIIPVIKDGRAIAWNIGTSPKTHHVRQHLLLEDRYKLNYYRQMVWKKVGVPVPLWFNTTQDPVARHFTPNYQHEIVLIFTKGKLQKGDPIIVDDLCSSDVFEFGQQFATTEIPQGLGRTGAQSNLDRRSRKAHPAAFPVRIPSMFISHLSGPNEIVLEPFAGAGATMVACENLGRKCYAMEISPEYCAVTLERMTTAFPHLKIQREQISRAA